MNEYFIQTLSAASKATKAAGDHVAALRVPTAPEVFDHLDHLAVYQGAILLVAGLIYMLWGWKTFKVLVTVNLAALGAYLGWMLGGMQSQQWSLYGMFIGAVVLAILAWPLMKFAVSLMGAAAGAFAGYHLWIYFTTLYRPDLTHAKPFAGVEAGWIAAFAGMMLLGAMAFVLFRAVVMLFTSLQGAVLAVAGGIALVLKYQPWHNDTHDYLLSPHHPHALPLLVIVPTIVGFLFQALALGKKKSAPPQQGGQGK